MVEQVNVCVRNLFINEDIEVFREHADGVREPSITIVAASYEAVLLPELGVFLIINPPTGVDISSCQFNVTKNEHLVSWEQMDDHWRMQMAANEDDPEVPTDVNVEVGGRPTLAP